MILRATKNNSNTIQAFWVALGSFCAFGFSLISSAIISRYLTKTDYGTYRQVMYVYHTLLTVFTLGLPRAYSYFLPRTEITEGVHLIKKLNLCFLILGIVFSSVLYFGASTIAEILKNRHLESAIKIFSPTPLFLLPTMGLEGILATYRKTHLNALYSVITRAISVLFVILPVIYYKANADIALEGFTASSIFTCVIGFYFMYLPFKGQTQQKTSVRLKDIFAFSLPLMFAGFWGIAERAADQFYISRWFGEIIFADFSNGSLELPFVGMVLSAGAVVLLPLFSKLSKDETNNTEIINLWRKSAVKAAYILYPLVTFAWFFSTPIMTFLYGDAYQQSGIYFKIMLIVNIFTIAQYYPILLALGKTKFYSNALLLSALAVWGLEYLSVSLLHNPYLVSGVSITVRIIRIVVFLYVISRALQCTLTDLFPFSILGRILLSSIISSLISYIIVSLYAVELPKLIFLVCGFMIFIIFELLTGKLLKIEYLKVINILPKHQS